jgi:hypothetical protein
METISIGFALHPATDPREGFDLAVASPVGEASIRDLACVGRRRPRPGVDVRFSRVSDFAGSGPRRRPPDDACRLVRRI